MTATLISKAHAEGVTSQTTPAIDTTGADFLLVVISYWSQSNTLSDSKTNSWNWRTTYGATNAFVKIGYVYNPNVGSGHTFSAYADFGCILFYAFSGMDITSAVYDTENGGNEVTNTGSITPNVTGELLVTAFCGGAASGNTSTVSGGFVIEDLTPYSSGVNPGGGVAFDNVYDSTDAVSCDWTDVAVANNALTIAAFKLASAGATLSVDIGMDEAAYQGTGVRVK